MRTVQNEHGQLVGFMERIELRMLRDLKKANLISSVKSRMSWVSPVLAMRTSCPLRLGPRLSKQRGRGQGTCPPADFDQRTTPLRLSPIANSAALHSGRIGRHCRSSLDTDLQSLIAAWDGLPEAKLKFGSLTDQQPTRRHRVRPLMAEILQKHRDDRLPHGPREKRRPLRSLVVPI